MKKITKIFMPVLLILLILVTASPAFAETSEVSAANKATDLKKLGLYAGTSTEKFEPDLGSALTREQGITMLLRMMGLESTANNMSESETETALKGYSDVAKVSAWARKSVAYAVKNGLVNGFLDKSLQASGQITGNQLATLMLKALGYRAESFSQATATFAAKVGITPGTLQITGGASLTRGDAVGMSYGALGATVSGGTLTLVQNLVAQGVVQKSAAEAAGFQAVATPVFVPYVPTTTNVEFLCIESIGTQTFSTTQLQLFFSDSPTTLSINDITVTGATKGELSGSGNTRTLTISDITVANGGNITVSISSPSGYSISPSSKTAAVVHLPILSNVTPVTDGTALTVSADALDVNYTWYRSTDTLLNDGDSQVGTGASYVPGKFDVGKYLIVRAVLASDSTVVSTVVTSAPVTKAAGITGNISGTFTVATSINLKGFAANASGIEAAVDIDGTKYSDYSPLDVDSSGNAVITIVDGEVSTFTKVKVKIGETDTTLAVPEQEITVTKISD